MSRTPRPHLSESGLRGAEERCACGHLRSTHDDRWATFGGLAFSVPGHGRCCREGCRCPRFRWAAWAFDPKRRRKRRGHQPAGAGQNSSSAVW
jgi:hypothetical protein